MKRDQIKVGAKSKSQREQLVLAYNRPENVADCMKICQANEATVASLFNRGLTIWLQDRFGRPMFEENAPAAEIQAKFDAAIPGITKGVSTKAAPISVTLEKGKKVFTQAEVEAKLKAAGITVVSE